MKERKTLNKPLLRKVARKLRRLRHEEHYDQAEWAGRTACGTAACIAGHVVLAAGGKLIWQDNGSDGDLAVSCLYRNRYSTPISEAARAALGLPLRYTWDWNLFSGDPDQAWPEPYATRWLDAKTGVSKERPSRIAADLLDAIADGTVRL